MGQLRTESAVFLSAGVPDPSAHHFVGDGDSVAISAAVAAVLEVTLGRRRLIWGGHPAITPMVWTFAESMGVDYGKWVLLYQSLRFKDDFPDENALFQNVVFTENVRDEVGPSLELMRERMLGENEFESAVFIGGMKGIIDECQLFARLAPGARIVPVVSTGGAARLLGESLGFGPETAEDLDYVRFMYSCLGVDPNERRYTTPAEQPAAADARIQVPHASR